MSFNGRLLHATPSFAPAYRVGGPVRSLEGLVRELLASGVSVRVLTTNSNGREKLDVPRGWQSWEGVPVRYLRRWAPPSATPSFAPVAYREAVASDLVHVTGIFSIASMQALGAALLAKRPVVLSPRGALQPEALKLGRAWEKRAWIDAFKPLLSRVRLFHATSEAEKRSIEDALGRSIPIAVVPNGTELTDLDTVRRLRKAPSLSPRIGFIGRIHPIKALEELIDAAALLRARGHAFELRIAGPIQDRVYHAFLLRKLEELGLTDNASFEGEVLGRHKDALYASSRVLVLPSRSENFGNVVIEALGFETPVVASHGTPWRELETHGAGRWVRGDSASLADAIEPFLRDSEIATMAGQRGRRLVAARYGWSAVAKEMLHAYALAVRSA